MLYQFTVAKFTSV